MICNHDLTSYGHAYQAYHYAFPGMILGVLTNINVDVLVNVNVNTFAGTMVGTSKSFCCSAAFDFRRMAALDCASVLQVWMPSDHV